MDAVVRQMADAPADSDAPIFAWDRLMNKILLVGAVLLIYDVSNAHHAPALYDNDRLMRIESEVIKLSFRFPHSEMRVGTANGQEWTISLAPPDVSERNGQKEALLAIRPGDQGRIRRIRTSMKNKDIHKPKERIRTSIN